MRQAQLIFLTTLFVVSAILPLTAQTNQGNSSPAFRTGAQVLSVTKSDQLLQIPADAKVIALNLTLKDIGSKEKAQSLVEWVQKGGVLWVHTDAAQLFDFRTVPAQSFVDLIGKAKSVAPWNAHPLTQGVRKIFYAMQPNSAFVVGHPRGTMIMRVSDHPTRTQPLFVCAEAAAGNGTVLFIPPDVNRQRAEGVAFLKNLEKYVSGEPTIYRVPVAEFDPMLAQWQQFLKERDVADAKKHIGAVTAYAHLWLGRTFHYKLGKSKEALAELEKAADANNQIAEIYAALGDVYTATGDKEKADVAQQRVKQLTKSERASEGRSAAGLILTEGELQQLVQLVDVAAGGSADDRKNKLAAMMTTLAGRIFYQAGDLASAEKLFTTAFQQDRTSRNALFWLGALRVTQGLQQPQLPSPQRATLLNDALNLWQQFGTAGGGTSEEPPNSALPLIEQLGAWVRGLREEVARLALEPPNVQLANGFIVRYTPGDAGWRFVLPLVQASLANYASMGLRAEEAELLVFPNQGSLEAYRQLVKGSLLDFGSAGIADIVGERVLIVIHSRERLARSSAHHLCGHVVANAWIEGVPDVPAWLVQGLGGDPRGQDPRPLLRQARQQGQLFNLNELSVPSAQLSDLFFAQSSGMVSFLDSVGKKKGGVVRVLQLIGIGVPVDAAIAEVTGLTPEQFIAAWARTIV